MIKFLLFAAAAQQGEIQGIQLVQRCRQLRGHVREEQPPLVDLNLVRIGM